MRKQCALLHARQQRARAQSLNDILLIRFRFRSEFAAQTETTI